MAEVTDGRPVGVEDARYADGHRRPTTVLPLRKSYTEWEEVEETLVDSSGEALTQGGKPIVTTGRVGSKPRFRFYPEATPEGPGRLSAPPSWHAVTRDQLMEFMRTGQVVDGRVFIDRAEDPSEGAYVYEIGAVPEGGNPDEIPLVLVEEV